MTLSGLQRGKQMPVLDAKKKVEILASFWNDGYIQIDNVLLEDDIELVLTDIKKLDFERVFITIHPEVMDPHREQANVDLAASPAMRLVNKIVVELISDLPTEWSVASESWHAMRSLPGGEVQQLHRDFPTFETTQAIIQHGWIQASAFIALQDNTPLLAVPSYFGGAAVRSKAETLKIKKGQMIIFRGDLAHARNAYAEENLRLLCYIRVFGVNQEPIATEAVIWESFRCVHCFKPCTSTRDLANHIRYCDDNPDKAVIAKKRKKEQRPGWTVWKVWAPLPQEEHTCEAQVRERQ